MSLTVRPLYLPDAAETCEVLSLPGFESRFFG